MTKIGKSLYKATIGFGKFLDKHIILYYVLAFTWGGLMTFFGLFVSLIMLICFRKPHWFHRFWYFNVGSWWGGFSLGTTCIRDKKSSNELTEHELGHTYQNCLFGPFFIFIVAIPSAIRYWYQTIREWRGKPNKDYDAIWFEGSATELGHIVCNKDYEGKNE